MKNLEKIGSFNYIEHVLCKFESNPMVYCEPYTSKLRSKILERRSFLAFTILQYHKSFMYVRKALENPRIKILSL